jgi:hypothetical protein
MQQRENIAKNLKQSDEQIVHQFCRDEGGRMSVFVARDEADKEKDKEREKKKNGGGRRRKIEKNENENRRKL